jgi:2-hydroxychromene-2-carboxylate isomerase
MHGARSCRRTSRCVTCPPATTSTIPFGRAFFASQQLGTLARTHAATFRALHDEQVLPMNPTDAELTAYYATLGVDAKKFGAALASPQVAASMKAARDFSLRIQLQGTPTLIVAASTACWAVARRHAAHRERAHRQSAPLIFSFHHSAHLTFRHPAGGSTP